MKKPLVVTLLFIFALVIGMLVGLVARPRQMPMVAPQNINKFDQALYYINTGYVDSINTDSIADVAMTSLMSELDPHSAYIPASDLDDVNSELSASFSGIGIQFNIQQDTVHVVAVVSGGPSEGIGILAGDRIVEVDDSSFVGKTITNERVLHTLRGPKGSTVRLGIKRNTSNEVLHFSVTRGDIPLHSVNASFIIAPETGFIRVTSFSANTYQEFISALARLRDMGAKRYIIDLRENPGGLMDQVIMMANEFLERNQMIVYAQGRAYDLFESRANGIGRFKQAPIVVLIDEFSASASEIFAGAMQDNDRALILGRRSFGKGLVQQQFELNDHSAIRLTVARYYTPSGRCIQKPYKMGEQTDYQYDLINRFENGEFYSRDSIHLKDTTIYKTIGGRNVYGGGGIMPDVFIAHDTTANTPWFNIVSNRALTYNFAFQYVDKNRDKLAAYKDWKQLEHYLLTQNIIDDFTRYAEKEGVKPVTAQISKSSARLRQILHAYIVRNMLGETDFYQLWMRDDTMVRKALNVISHLNATIGNTPL